MIDDRNRRAPTPSAPPPRPRDTDEALDRLQALETRVLVYEERTDNRLNHGAATMGEIKTVLGDLKPKRQSWLGATGIAIALAGTVFAAGRYPDRSELERSQEHAVSTVDDLRVQLQLLERELVRLRTALEGLEKRVDELRLSLDRTVERSRRKP